LNKNDILKKLKELELDKDKYIIISGASLVVQGIIEETKDIDLTCSKSFYDLIDWDIKKGAFDLEVKYKDVFEIGDNLYEEDDYVIIDGFKFMPLESCLKLKRKLNRSKDKKIITKLDLILGSNDNYRYERELNERGINLIAGCIVAKNSEGSSKSVVI